MTTKNQTTQAMQVIRNAIYNLDGITATAKICGVSHVAVSRWWTLGKLPATEFTGKTKYAVQLSRKRCGFTKKELLDASRLVINGS